MNGEVVISSRYTGPPSLANGGYVAGLLAERLGPGFRYRFRASVPLDTPMTLEECDGKTVLMNGDKLCVEVDPAPPLPTLRTAPSEAELAEAEAAAIPSFHRFCVCCSPRLDDCLKVSVGPFGPTSDGVVAGRWTAPHGFAGPDGTLPEATVWAAMDCPGYYAWEVREERHFALTAAMSGAVWEAPVAGETYLMMAWTGDEISVRRRIAGVGLYRENGQPIAQMVHEWIKMPPDPRMIRG